MTTGLIKAKNRMNRKITIPGLLSKLGITICVLIISGNQCFAQDLQKVVDLNERWRFSIGDSYEWADPDYDDSGWEWVYVPSAWENQGFHGYDGFAWYRTTFRKTQLTDNESLFLRLGNIDDVDEVYLNGKKIGSTGCFPPNYTTAYKSHRLYTVPTSLLRENNTIAVRVYDDVGEGGIIHGDISLVIDREAMPVDVDLRGSWKFRIGEFAHERIGKLETWDDIIVPGFWEDQGYKNYDGYACYAIEFKLEEEFANEKMVLVLGKIDDIDQVFVNGVLVGQSGEFHPQTVNERSNSYLQLRGYYLPDNLLKTTEKNLIVVRVYDHIAGGGIYTGSVGLISQENYIKYWNKKRRRY